MIRYHLAGILLELRLMIGDAIHTLRTWPYESQHDRVARARVVRRRQ